MLLLAWIGKQRRVQAAFGFGTQPSIACLNVTLLTGLTCFKPCRYAAHTVVVYGRLRSASGL